MTIVMELQVICHVVNFVSPVPGNLGASIKTGETFRNSILIKHSEP